MNNLFKDILSTLDYGFANFQTAFSKSLNTFPQKAFKQNIYQNYLDN